MPKKHLSSLLHLASSLLLLASCPLLLASCLLLLCIPSCTGKKPQTQSATTLRFWHSFVASTVPAFNELVHRFEEEHPGITIDAQYVPTGDALIQKLIAAIESHTAPDIAWIHADFLDKLVEARAIYRMNEFMPETTGLADEDVSDIFPPLLQAARWRDTLYAMPMEATSLALLYNKRLFRQAGLDPERPPQTWDELRSYAKRLTVDVDGDGKIDQYGLYVPVFPASGELSIWMILQWTPFLWQAGGQEIDSAQTRVLFNSEAGVKALTLWKEIYDEEDFSTFAIAHDLGFASQRLAMIFDGPWNLPRYRMLKDFDWGVAPLPAGPAGRATYIAGEHLAIFRQSEHPKEAWKFVKWMIRPDVQEFFSMNSGYLPVRRSVLKMKEYQDFLARDPALRAYVAQMEVGRARRPIDVHRVEINRYLAEAIEKSLVGNIDPKIALDEAAEKANRLLHPMKGEEK